MENTSQDQAKILIESDIFEYLGLKSMSQEEQDAIIEKTLINLNNRVSIRIADFLEDKDPALFEQFKTMLAKDGGEDEKTKFLADNKVPIDVFYGEEALYLKAELMQLKR